MARVEDFLQNAQLELARIRMDAATKIRGAQMQAQAKEGATKAKLQAKLQDTVAKAHEAHQKIQAAQADAQGASEPPIVPAEVIPPPATKALQGVPTAPNFQTIAQRVADNPGSIQGGAAVQGGVQAPDQGMGGVQIPGLNQIPQTLTSNRQTTSTQLVPNDYGLLPVQTTSNETLTQPNALHPAQVLQLQLQQQHMKQQERAQDAALMLDIGRTYGSNVANIGSVVGAMQRGDLDAVNRLMANRKPLTQQEHEAMNGLRAEQAAHLRADIGRINAETDLAKAKLNQMVSYTPISVLGGYRDSNTALQSFNKQDPGKLQSNWNNLFKDGKLIADQVSVTANQVENIDRGEFRPLYTSFMGKGVETKSFPVEPIMSAMVLLSAGPDARKKAGVSEKDLVKSLNEAGIKVGPGGHYFHDDEINNPAVNVLEQAAETHVAAGIKTGAWPAPPPSAPIEAAPKTPAQKTGLSLGKKIHERMSKPIPRSMIGGGEQPIGAMSQDTKDKIAGFLQGLMGNE